MSEYARVQSACVLCARVYLLAIYQLRWQLVCDVCVCVLECVCVLVYVRV